MEQVSSFNLQVYAQNSKPFFEGRFQDLVVRVGESLQYFLPFYSDFDSTDILTLEITEKDSNSLPSFVSYAPLTNSLIVEPLNLED